MASAYGVTYRVANMPLVENNSLNAVPAASAAAPAHVPIGPEIGPDPKNAACAVRFEDVPYEAGNPGIRYDFAYGYRIMTPAGDDDYQVWIYDLDSGMPLEQYELKGGQLGKP